MEATSSSTAGADPTIDPAHTVSAPDPPSLPQDYNSLQLASDGAALCANEQQWRESLHLSRRDLRRAALSAYARHRFYDCISCEMRWNDSAFQKVPDSAAGYAHPIKTWVGTLTEHVEWSFARDCILVVACAIAVTPPQRVTPPNTGPYGTTYDKAAPSAAGEAHKPDIVPDPLLWDIYKDLAPDITMDPNPGIGPLKTKLGEVRYPSRPGLAEGYCAHISEREAADSRRPYAIGPVDDWVREAPPTTVLFTDSFVYGKGSADTEITSTSFYGTSTELPISTAQTPNSMAHSTTPSGGLESQGRAVLVGNWAFRTLLAHYIRNPAPRPFAQASGGPFTAPTSFYGQVPPGARHPLRFFGEWLCGLIYLDFSIPPSSPPFRLAQFPPIPAGRREVCELYWEVCGVAAVAAGMYRSDVAGVSAQLGSDQSFPSTVKAHASYAGPIHLSAAISYIALHQLTRTRASEKYANALANFSYKMATSSVYSQTGCFLGGESVGWWTTGQGRLRDGRGLPAGPLGGQYGAGFQYLSVATMYFYGNNGWHRQLVRAILYSPETLDPVLTPALCDVAFDSSDGQLWQNSGVDVLSYQIVRACSDGFALPWRMGGVHCVLPGTTTTRIERGRLCRNKYATRATVLAGAAALLAASIFLIQHFSYLEYVSNLTTAAFTIIGALLVITPGLLERDWSLYDFLRGKYYTDQLSNVAHYGIPGRQIQQAAMRGTLAASGQYSCPYSNTLGTGGIDCDVPTPLSCMLTRHKYATLWEEIKLYFGQRVSRDGAQLAECQTRGLVPYALQDDADDALRPEHYLPVPYWYRPEDPSTVLLRPSGLGFFRGHYARPLHRANHLHPSNTAVLLEGGVDRFLAQKPLLSDLVGKMELGAYLTAMEEVDHQPGPPITD